jgi:hypothetical protein
MFLDLKNKGLNPLVDRGEDILTLDIIESVERYAKTSSKDLILIMQINKKFVKKICSKIIKMITEPRYSTE